MEKKNPLEARMAEREAAHLLMEKWVKEHTSEITYFIEDVLPYLLNECDISDMIADLGIVNLTFAAFALEVMKANNNNEPLCLPADATEMQNAIFDLTNFFKRLQRARIHVVQYINSPAFELCKKAFEDEEIYA